MREQQNCLDAKHPGPLGNQTRSGFASLVMPPDPPQGPPQTPTDPHPPQLSPARRPLFSTPGVDSLSEDLWSAVDGGRGEPGPRPAGQWRLGVTCLQIFVDMSPDMNSVWRGNGWLVVQHRGQVLCGRKSQLHETRSDSRDGLSQKPPVGQKDFIRCQPICLRHGPKEIPKSKLQVLAQIPFQMDANWRIEVP